MLLNEKIRTLPASPTLLLSQKANSLRAEGKDVINMTVGESSHHMPVSAKIESIKSTLSNFTQYTSTDGIADLKQLVQKYFERNISVHYDLNEIIVGPGAKYLIYAALACVLEKYDEVIILCPYWPSYPSIVQMLGGRCVFVETQKEQQFHPNVRDIENAISVKTKALILNTPSNPTGVVYTKKTLEDLGQILHKREILVISDEIYSDITYTPYKHHSIASISHMKDKVIVINGASKSFCMTGLRIGYCAGPKNLIEAIKILSSQIVTCPCSVSQRTALGALQHKNFSVLHTNTLKKKRDIVYDTITQQISSFFPQILLPHGSFYFYLNCEHLLQKLSQQYPDCKSDFDLAYLLIEQQGLALVPGSAFGCSPYLRLSYALQKNHLRSGLQKLISFCYRV